MSDKKEPEHILFSISNFLLKLVKGSKESEEYREKRDKERNEMVEFRKKEIEKQRNNK